MFKPLPSPKNGKKFSHNPKVPKKDHYTYMEINPISIVFFFIIMIMDYEYYIQVSPGFQRLFFCSLFRWIV